MSNKTIKSLEQTAEEKKVKLIIERLKECYYAIGAEKNVKHETWIQARIKETIEYMNTYLRRSQKLVLKPKKTQLDAAFIQGYACSIATIIKMNGGLAFTDIREAFVAGCLNLQSCVDAKVDQHDLDILAKHFE